MDAMMDVHLKMEESKYKLMIKSRLRV